MNFEQTSRSFKVLLVHGRGPLPRGVIGESVGETDPPRHVAGLASAHSQRIKDEQ